MVFKDRKEAGEKLAEALSKYEKKKDCIVLGLPRGGVVLADEITKKLKLPLDIVVPRKIGAPGNPEFAIGAISEEGDPILNDDVIKTYDISKDYIEDTVKEERAEARRRLKVYRGDREPLKLEGKTAILVDDGIATGHTMRAAIASARARKAKKVVVAVPVSAKDSLKKVKEEADEVVCLSAPIFFAAVGQFYEEFGQTEDEEVIELMKQK